MATVQLNVSAHGDVADPNGLVDAIGAAIASAAPELVGGVTVTLQTNLEGVATEPTPPAPEPAP